MCAFDTSNTIVLTIF